MIRVEQILEVQRLLRVYENGQRLSQKKISVLVGISKMSVGEIFHGRITVENRRLVSSKSQPKYPPSHAGENAIVARCPTCGYRVYLPCLLCRHRDGEDVRSNFIG